MEAQTLDSRKDVPNAWTADQINAVKIIKMVSILYESRENERKIQRQMELNTIKKELYKQKQTAYFKKATKSGLLYETTIVGQLPEYVQYIHFLIPFKEIGDSTFSREESAKLLIRYLI